ncbi:diguanylate cyclase (GGDEF)-like protein [Sphaerotilus hippei]|uniref:diguanylate cyclase n=1 Tax=Sphaerotilus hippei TaxID=744406 RepID=A0A318H3B2_9BURK|nr:GGDEF domain-containing protein [Sphaerotilus hippei]PXW97930.1 diguanylate cyclase (GGDEF)-like protein [Sphaerotilus hippei]
MTAELPALLTALLLSLLVLVGVASAAVLTARLSLAGRRHGLFEWMTASVLAVGSLACLVALTRLTSTDQQVLVGLAGHGLFAGATAVWSMGLHRSARGVGWAGAEWWLVAAVLLALPVLTLGPVDAGVRALLLAACDVVLLIPGLWVLWRPVENAAQALGSARLLLPLIMLMRLAPAALALQTVVPLSSGWPGPVDPVVAALTLVALVTAMGWSLLLARLDLATRRIKDTASHDSLTGCLNRSTADALLEHQLLLARRSRESVALVLIDIDGFSVVNRRHGRRVGDLVLQTFAEVVRSRLRSSDVFCRLGGEEFAMVLPATDAPGARRLAEDVRAAVLAMEVITPGATVQISISAGLAIAAPDASTSLERLYERAEDALRRAKQYGSNRVEQASVEMVLVSG